MFDRVEQRFDVALKYGSAMRPRFAPIRQGLNPQICASPTPMRRADAATEGGEVAMMGYCMGGDPLPSSRRRELDFACAFGYYGGQIGAILRREAQGADHAQFGEKDPSISLTDVEKIKASDVKGIFHIYKNADHGFCGGLIARATTKKRARCRKSVLSSFLDQHL